MTTKQTPSRPTRIGIAIEIGLPMSHHQNCYKGILDYLRTHRPEWETIVDPYLVGPLEHRGVLEYDGIVGRIEKAPAELARARGIPVVNHWFNSPSEGVPGVFTDHRACGRMVGRHLIEKGYRRLGMVSWESDRARPLYFAGLQEPAQAEGITVQTLNVPYTFESDPESFVTFYNLLRETLQNITPPIGLFVPMDSMAVYVVQLCRELGLSVPNDVGIAVLYNALDLCLNTQPTLTSIEASDAKVGYEAMRLLDQLLTGQASPPAEPLLIEPKTLRIRGSSEVFVSEEPVVAAAMRFIAEHARDAITVDDVAQAASVSKRTLSRRFNEHVGRSVLSEINRIRAQSIKQALVDTDQTMSEIADACGFANTSHFNVFFRKATSMTPGAYRKKHRHRG